MANTSWSSEDLGAFVIIPPVGILYQPARPAKNQDAALPRRALAALLGRDSVGPTCSNGDTKCTEGDWCCSSGETCELDTDGSFLCCQPVGALGCNQVCSSDQFQCSRVCCSNGSTCVGGDTAFGSCAAAAPTSTTTTTTTSPTPTATPTTTPTTTTPTTVSTQITTAVQTVGDTTHTTTSTIQATTHTAQVTSSTSQATMSASRTQLTSSSTSSATIPLASGSRSDAEFTNSSTSSSSAETTAQGNATVAPVADADGGLSTSGKIAIGVTIPVVIILLIIGILLYVRRRRNTSQKQMPETGPGDYVPTLNRTHEAHGSEIQEMPGGLDYAAIPESMYAVGSRRLVPDQPNEPFRASPPDRYEMSSTPAANGVWTDVNAPVPQPAAVNISELEKFEMAGTGRKSPHHVDLQRSQSSSLSQKVSSMTSTERDVEDSNLSEADRERRQLEQRQSRIANEKERLMRLAELDREEEEVERRLREL